MKKILNPCSVEINGRFSPVFCKAEYTDGKLSISGVVGPLESGNCRGSCGQIDMSFRDGHYPERKYTEGWTPELFQRFLDTWREWHLNDLRAGCVHQREMDWKSCPGHYQAGEICADEAVDMKCCLCFHSWVSVVLPMRDAPQRCPRCKSQLIESGKIRPGMKPPAPASSEDMERALRDLKRDGVALVGAGKSYRCAEDKLSKPCPVCGYKYGSAWLKEEVPASVLEFLQSLPNSLIIPAWV